MLCEGYLKVLENEYANFMRILANSVTNENPKTHVKIEMYKNHRSIEQRQEVPYKGKIPPCPCYR